MSFLPSKDRRYLADRDVSFHEVVEGNKKGVVLENFLLPAGKYQTASADILIMLPPAYPDAPPDMFYAFPHLQLVASHRQPNCTNVRINFDRKSWQRWSRHNDQWRPGVDGLWTMVKRIEQALEVAA
ncbi:MULTISPECIES: E2/UBC family protein [Thalassospira]|jgi:hypothetical protein|uniref:E2/UBC family protein n=1 Tax=Thalassospira TaxID=168934 RepID=UPI0008DE3F1C|nr:MULTISPECIES: E2/UBC family protein [Thalassospira]MDM7975840.1 E2/UBC family protein [Thalassospira xiamenensis]OHY99990.1 hypothetical protein BC440_19380 [Thalassospira sp. MIT1004]|tara:strand:- start:12948 stop:13328 length:381 start_codon:yes stop_codon:yes gene_type:complete